VLPAIARSLLHGLDAFIGVLLGWLGADAFSAASRVGFSELFGGHALKAREHPNIGR